MTSFYFGLDVAKDGFVLCQSDPTTSPRSWQVHTLTYDNLTWHEQLAAIVPAGSTVVAEPAGHTLIAPIAAALQMCSARLFLVDNAATGDIRRQHLSKAKTDDLDARALALIATWVETHLQPLSVRPYFYAAESLAQTIRLYLNTHRRHIKESTRTLNQLDTIGHGIWPELARRKDTWLRAVSFGAVSPLEIKKLLDSETPIKQRHYIEKLAAILPDIEAEAPTTHAVIDLYQSLHQRKSQIAQVEQIISSLLEHPQIVGITSLWRTVPGAGVLSLAALHVATKCQTANFSPEGFRAAVAVAPKTKRSAGVDVTDMDRSGFKPAGAALYLWTMQLVKPTAPANPIRDFYQRTNSTRAFFAARAKLATILHAIAINGQPCNW